jgi:NADH:ubiquinone oxidoreductase subunit 5 (subunit L)/multisubunit Na+/H+ antiporter MnhA subunit
MDFFANNILLIMFLPLWVGLIVLSGALLRLYGNRKMTAFLTISSSIVGMIFSFILFNHVRNPQPLVLENSFLWFNTNSLNIFLGTRLDDISTTFLSILMLISVLVQIYSYGYMKHKNCFNRYYLYLNLLNFSMIGVILSPNLIQMYIFTELVCIISYLLTSLFNKEENIADSSKNMFVFNRVANTLFLAGIIIFAYFALTYMSQNANEFLAFNNLDYFQNQLMSLTEPKVYNLICLLFLFSAFITSVQFPFQKWLIESSNAKVPVCALFQSVTLTTLGILLIIRISPFLNNFLSNVLIVFGLITALTSSFIAITETDLKKLLSYLTSSQLGLVITTIGLGKISVALIFLVIHSFTKTLLFLCAGKICKMFNSTNLKNMAGLRKADFNLSLYWLVGCLSLSGMFLGGLASKTMLINAVQHNATILFLVLFSYFMITYAIFKSYFQIFGGDEKPVTLKKSKSMTFSIMVLCVFVIFPGFIFKLSDFNMSCGFSTFLGLYVILVSLSHTKCKIKPLPPLLYKLSKNELYLPKFYSIIEKFFSKSFFGLFVFDKNFIDVILLPFEKIQKYLFKTLLKINNRNSQTFVSLFIFITGIILLVIVYLYFAGLEN